jgi:hypothetical protein
VSPELGAPGTCRNLELPKVVGHDKILMARSKDLDIPIRKLGNDMVEDAVMSVGSSTEYDYLIAEVKFGDVAGFIISKEPNDTEFMISIHSFRAGSINTFDFTKNVPGEKISLSKLKAALIDAENRLNDLGSN